MHRIAARLAVLAILVALALPSGRAFAQAACPISAEAPKTTTATTYTLSAADHCSMIVFTSASATALTPPNANTVPVGFKVWIKAQGSGTVTVGTPTAGTIDGSAAPGPSITTGTGVELRADGTNWYSSGLGIKKP
jgi:hypothetical protein